MKWISLDFEYRDAREPHLTLVAGCICGSDISKPRAFWLLDSPSNQAQLRELIRSYTGAVIFSYSCAAESRSLQALGLNPLDFKWFDPMIAYRAFINVPGGKMDQTGLLNCCMEFGIEYRHADEKSLMVDTILNSKVFPAELKRRILMYCAEDTLHLYDLAQKVLSGLVRKYRMDATDLFKRIISWSEYVACLGICESQGTPVNKSYVDNITLNFNKLKFYFSELCIYPFYQFDHKKNTYVLKRELFQDYIISNKFDKIWPLTDSEDSFSMDKAAFDEFGHLSPELESMSFCKRVLDAAKNFNPHSSIYQSTIGTDDCSRTYFNPFGSLTGRNQPPAQRFLLLMPSAFRCMMQPPEGYAISSIDWSAQEFILGAALSQDDKMIAAYQTGDPYLAFGKLAGAIPDSGTKKTHAAMRDLFKSTCLGLQYSMGIDKLKFKLHKDTKQDISRSKAEQLSILHKKTFNKYWAWVKNIDKQTRMHTPAQTLDGWLALPDGEKLTSMRNFPIQGGGASLMRRAMVYAVREGLPVICAHHDAVYICHKIDDTESLLKLQACMDRATRDFIGDIQIRTSIETHDRSHDWVEDRAKKTYDQLLPFISTPDAQVTLKNSINPEVEQFNLFEI